jgi:translation initiation factor IF-3
VKQNTVEELCAIIFYKQMNRMKPTPKTEHKNLEILKFRKVRLITIDGNNSEIVSPKVAYQKALDSGLDAVIVGSDGDGIPVCRLINFGKLEFEKKKSKQANKPKTTKTLTFSPVTATHDLQTVKRKAEKFLKEGHEVTFTCRFRPTQLAHPEQGEERLKYLASELAEIAKVKVPTKREGRLMSCTLQPI